MRKMYSAEIVGLQSPTTVAVITGPGAEEQWKSEVARYSNIRHPNLFHLYGITSSGGIHALIFHDDLVPWPPYFCHEYDASHFFQVFFCISMRTQVHGANQHVQHISGRPLGLGDYTVWIRPSKGALHIELTPPESRANVFDPVEKLHALLPPSSSLLNPPHPSELMRSISLESYHGICSWDLAYDDWFTPPTGMQTQLGSIVHVPNLADGGGKLHEGFQVAAIPGFDDITSFWCTEDTHVDGAWTLMLLEEGTVILPEGWIRVDSTCVVDRYCLCTDVNPTILKAWVAQASHVFASLEITGNRHEYVFLHCWRVIMQLSGPVEDLPPGYVFLCPPAYQLTGNGRYQVPECPAYWSLDPSGAQRLTREEAARMGFPQFELDIKMGGFSWSEEDYAGIREFHVAKGYDPDSLHVAKDLRYRLYDLACEKDELHAFLRHFGKDGESNASIEVASSEMDKTGSIFGEENDSVEDDSEAPATSGVDESYAFIEMTDSEMDRPRWIVGEQDDSVEDVPGVYQSSQFDEAEITQPSPPGMFVIYVQLALIGLCFALTLCGL
ncbi:hypothetical protein FB45DRAFT_1049863 [Roridomyces roridus]|uniref:Uncharacterized protein n=1 Tax=Roridomyces roridus TaxID=1738132 RepID=A0AAD7CHV4_9AGAR|nr:hypothetical protein FB45DRAFT_1049863 [Roridomyces roridus]